MTHSFEPSYPMSLLKSLIPGYFFISIFVIGCQSVQEPEFKKLEKVKIVSITKDTFILISNAIYHNPNPVGGNLSNTKVDITIEGIKMSDIIQNHEITFGGSQDFKLPIEIKVPISELYGQRKGILGKAISLLGNRKLKLSYSGNANLEIANIKFSIPIERRDTIEIKF